MIDKHSKTIIAIFAVLIMLGGALVPLTYPGTEATVEDTDDESSSFSLATIIEKIKEKGTTIIEKLDLGNATLVPTDVVIVGGTKTFPTEITGEEKVTEGNTGKFGSTTTFKNNGYIHVLAGGVLELFPVGNDSTYTINNEYCDDHTTRIIVMDEGAILSILGMKFVLKTQNDVESWQVLGMGKVDETKTNAVSVTFSYKKANDSDKYTLSMNIGSNCKVGFAEESNSNDKGWALVLRENGYKTEVKVGDKTIPANHPDISFTGTISGSTSTEYKEGEYDKYNLSVSATGFLLVDARGTEALVQGHVSIEKGDISISYATYEKSDLTNIGVNANVKATIDAQVYYIDHDKKGKEVKTLFVTVNNGLIQTGDVKVIVSMTTGKYRFSLIEKGDFALSVDSINVNLAAILEENGKMDIVITDVNLSGKNVNISGAIDMGGIPFSMISDLKIVIESVSLSLTSANVTFKNVERITGDKELTVTFVKDFAFKLQNVNIVATKLNNMNIKVGEFSLKGYVGKYLFRFAELDPMKYDLIVDLSIKDLNVIVSVDGGPFEFDYKDPLSGILGLNGKVTISVGSLDVSAKIVYDGVEKGLQINIENVKGVVDFDKAKFATIDASIGKIYAKSNIPMRFLDEIIRFDNTFPIEITTALLGVGSVEAELQANNLTCYVELDQDKSGEITVTPEFKADSFEMTFTNGVKYKEFHMKFSDNLVFDFDNKDWEDEESNVESYYERYYSLTVECGNVEGYYTSYTGSKNSFSVTENPKVGIGMMELSIKDWGEEPVSHYKYPYMGVLNIYSGNAKFEGGLLPITIRVSNGATFSANGLTAPMFIFDGGCVKSGTVVLDPNAFEMSTVYKYYFEHLGVKLDFNHIYRTAMLIDNNYVIRTPTVFGDTEVEYLHMTTAYEGGYKLTFDLSDITSGKIEANTGKELPESYSNETGFSMELTDKDNKQSGTFTIVKNAGDVTYLDLKCTGKNYVLSYANSEDKKEYKCGEKVTLKDEIPKENYTFLGWSDGTGTIYAAGSEYIMPARDVTMTPVYNKVLTAVPEIKDGTVSVTVDSQYVTFSVPEGDWNEMTIRTANATVTISHVAYDELQEVTTGATDKLMFGCVEPDTVYNDDLAQLVSGKNLYAMKMYFVDDSGEATELVPASYDGFTEMQVTVFLKTDKNLNNVKIQYVNPNGFLEEVKVDSWEKVDGGYNITFTVTHFSIYAVEPSYSDNNTALIIAAVVIVLILIGLGAWYYNRSKHKA